MATVEPYSTAEGRRYRVRYRKPDHRQTTKRGFKTKREAELFLASVEVSKASGSYIDPTQGQIGIDILGDRWLEGRTGLKPSSLAVIESAWRLHVRPRWSMTSVAAVRHSDIQAWLSELSKGKEGAKGKSPSLVHRSYGILSAILDNAVNDRRIGSNPARGVSLPRKTGREHRYLTHEEVHRLAESCGTHGALIRTLAYTGLRWGEVTALRVRDIDFTRCRLMVSQNAVLVSGVVVVGTPKSHKRRVVPFPELLSPSIRTACTRKSEDDLVFAGTDGRHLRTPTVKPNSWLDRALVMADLPPMTIHDLRHTAASLAVASGANVKAVQRMLGHASAAMTLDTYADLFDDDLDGVAVRLNHAAMQSNVVKAWSERDSKSPPNSVD